VLPVLADNRAFSLGLLTTISPVDPDLPPLIANSLDCRVIATIGHYQCQLAFALRVRKLDMNRPTTA